MKYALQTLAAIGFAAAVTFGASSASAFMPAETVKSTSDVTLVAMEKKPAKQFWRTKVRLSTDEAPGTIIVDTNNKYLYYIEGPNRATRYGIGVGREGFGWSGVVKVQRKAEWPGWTPPPEMVIRERKKGRILPAFQEGGIDNPLGARALYLYKGKSDSGFRIHGTNQPWTIGTDSSNGCFRMVNEHVMDLYNRVRMGANVVVL
jgi:lipoprotein-anchoring transpeptidase ErfK/SrfK